MANGNDIPCPAQLRKSHFDRMIRQMMSNNKEVERLIKRTIKCADEEKENEED